MKSHFAYRSFQRYHFEISEDLKILVMSTLHKAQAKAAIEKDDLSATRYKQMANAISFCHKPLVHSEDARLSTNADLEWSATLNDKEGEALIAILTEIAQEFPEIRTYLAGLAAEAVL